MATPVTIRLVDDEKNASRTAIELKGTQETSGGELTVKSLLLTRAGDAEASLAVAGPEIRFPIGILQEDGTNRFRLKRPTATFAVELSFQVDGGVSTLFGTRFEIKAGVQVTLRIVLTPSSALNAAVVELAVTGKVEIGDVGGAIKFSPIVLGFRIVLDDIPTFPSNSPPGLELLLPSDLPWPRIRLPWVFPLRLPAIPNTIRIPAYSILLFGEALRVGWDAIVVSADPSIPAVFIEVVRFRVKGFVDLYVSLKLKYTESDIDLEIPEDSAQIGFKNLKFRRIAPDCFGFDSDVKNLAPVLSLLSGELVDPKQDGKIQFRVHATDGTVEEVRLDWALGTDPATSRTLTLPGFEIDLKALQMFSLVAQPPNDDEGGSAAGGRLAVAATLAAKTKITARTTFGWPLDDAQQEKFRDGASSDKSLFSLEFDLKSAMSIALVDIPLGGGGKPQFVRKLATPIPTLDELETDAGGDADDNFIHAVLGPCPETSLETAPFTLDDIDEASIEFKVGGKPFTFPFLNGPAPGGGTQLLQVIGVEKKAASIDPLVLKLNLKLQVTIGGLTLLPTAEVTFDVSRMAFKVELAKGIDVKLSSGGGTFLGLKWAFKPNSDGVAFNLVVDKRNYALRQASGAVFTLAYDRATMPDDEILFNIHDFALTPKGVNLAAEITDKPARLNGLETQFRFTEGAIQITENRVAGFSIAGTGPLPPALVGDAVADVALQFAQVGDGNVQLVRGAAKIRGPKLLSCKATRFEFELDGLGLNYVNDGGADHLYFTLSGKARYKLQGGDDASGPLAWLPGIEIQLVDCPLTGNTRVIAKHIKFLIELPKKVRFSFLGCFTMELRSIGFVPQFDKFAGEDTSAMRLGGQIMFGETGDVLDAKIDLHDLYVARPEPGKFLPRLYLKSLGIRIAQGETFALEATVDFFNGEEIEPGIKAFGFVGEGSVAIKGLPPIAASMAWVRVSGDNGATWKRAWFLYLEARQMSLRIPVVEIYIREIGFGFGYRYTLASFKAADEITDVRKLLKKLKELSRTQGNLSKRDQWRVDLETAGEDPRWTVVLRALFASSSAQTSPFTGYDAESESQLPCLYILDAVLAVRSDLTFFLAGRAWLNTNYHDFYSRDDIKNGPLLSGFMLLSPRQKRFLANLSSNPGAQFGDHPPIPEFLKDMIRQSQFTATLLIEPGLLHYELGWPNQLRAKAKLGPLDVEIRAGTIFRLSSREMVIGQSLLARGKLELKAEFSAGFFGAGLYALADVAYGARYIGVLAFDDPVRNSAFYGAVGLDIKVQLDIRFWLRIKIAFFKISIDLSFSLFIQFTAALQIGITLTDLPGALGTATVSIRVMGRQCNFGVRVGINDGTVESARQRTERFLHIGLEAEEVEAIPGVPERGSEFSSNSVSAFLAPAEDELGLSLVESPVDAATSEVATPGKFHTPDYYLGQAESDSESDDNSVTVFLLLLPRSPVGVEADGFFPTPPENNLNPTPPNKELNPKVDFSWAIPRTAPSGAKVFHWDTRETGEKKYKDITADVGVKPIEWVMPWSQEVDLEAAPGSGSNTKSLLGYWLRLAYVFTPKIPASSEHDGHDPKDITPVSDPETYWLPHDIDPVEDNRVQNPTATAFEAAVRGAAEQFAAPYFRFDPDSKYDQKLREAFRPSTSVYTKDGQAPGGDNPNPKPNDNQAPTEDQAAVETRGAIIQAITRDFFEYASLPKDSPRRAKLESESLAFRFGLVLKVTGPRDAVETWIDKDDGKIGDIKQRDTVKAELGSVLGKVIVFNRRMNWFTKRSPDFNKVRTYSHANTVAIDWRLEYPNSKATLSNPLEDPQQHLRYYRIRREHLDGNDPTAEFTLKPADVLHREPSSDPDVEATVCRLPPRFQFVDHFDNQTAADISLLTAAGKTYLYTITPIDVAGKPSPRPLSLAITRFPSDPPQVPADGELVIDYPIQEDLKNVLPPTRVPVLHKPAVIRFRFSDPVEPVDRAAVPIGKYWLIFRREPVIPVGFYGADEAVHGAQHRGLAISNARRLRTDIALEFSPADVTDDPSGERADSGRRIRQIIFDSANDWQQLRNLGLYPGADKSWRPEGWSIFVQTETASGGGRPTGVRSALAPVAVRFHFQKTAAKPADPGFIPGSEDRQFARLEWLPKPVSLNLLDPVDTTGEVGFAKMPMPTLEDHTKWRFTGVSAGEESAPGLRFEQHPARMRAVKLVWNQGPCGDLTHPLDLHARYQVYEYDVFVKPGDVLNASGPTSFPVWAERSGLKKVQEVDLLPGDDVANLPSDPGDPLLWEVWYPGTSRRLLVKSEQIKTTEWPATSDAIYGPWFSFRESYLGWPDSTGLIDKDKQRRRAFHPFLEDVAAYIGRVRSGQAFPLYHAESGPQPSRGGDQKRANVTEVNPISTEPGALNKFLKSTAPEADPSGWGILQRMGLALGLRVRKHSTGLYVSGAELLQLIQEAIDKQTTKKTLTYVANDRKQAITVRLKVQAKDQFYRIETAGSAAVTETSVNDLFTAPSVMATRTDGEIVITLWGDKISIDSVSNATLKTELPKFDPKGFLHIEQLFQPGKRMTIREKEYDNGGNVPLKAALSLVQLSLRPTVQQSLLYQRVKYDDLPSGAKVEVTFTVPNPDHPTIPKLIASYLQQIGTPGEPITLPPGQTTVTLAASTSGSLTLLLRGTKPELITLAARNLSTNPPSPINPTERKAISPTSWDTAFFSVPELTTEFPRHDTDSQTQWDKFVEYVRIAEPTISGSELAPDASKEKPPGKTRAELLGWLTRFFGTGGDIDPSNPKVSASTTSAIWVASGYPRAATPLPLAPDSAGRLTSYHSIDSLWGQSFRYYVRPRGRYELIWEELGRSRSLVKPECVGNIEKGQTTIDAPKPGGADVALARIRPVAAPLVLSSRRLDPLVPVGTIPPPGSTWEVLVVKHSEQDLIEKNRSLVHHLEYSQTTVSQLRVFEPIRVVETERGAKSKNDLLDPLRKAFALAVSGTYSANDSSLEPKTPKLFLSYGKDGAHQWQEIDRGTTTTVANTATVINTFTETTGVRATVVAPGANADKRLGFRLVLESKNPDRFVSLRGTADPNKPSLVSTPDDLTEDVIEWPTWENSGLTTPELPEVSEQPDHLDLSSLDESKAVQLDLPFRSSQFTRGLMAIQYQSLPFFYTYTMLLVAQTAEQVSPITTVVHQDFEYVSPGAASLMEGVIAGDGKRFRRITIKLARLWDSLPTHAQEAWPIESPQTISGDSNRRPGSVTDSDVVYAIVISRPGSGNVEVVAEYTFNAKTDDPTKYESRKLPGPFRGEPVRLNPGLRGAGNKDRAMLETILLPTTDVVAFTLSSPAYPSGNITAQHLKDAGLPNRVEIVAGATGQELLRWKDALTKPTETEIAGLATLVDTVPKTAKAAVKQLRADVLALAMAERSVVPVSSQRKFATTTIVRRWPNAEMYPRNCALRTHPHRLPDKDGEPQFDKELSEEELAAIRELMTKVDAPFANALRSLLTQSGAARFAVTCVGLEQLAELHDAVEVTPRFRDPFTPSTGKIKWKGPIDKAQREAITTWVQTSVFTATFAKLLEEFVVFKLSSPAYPAGNITAQHLKDAGLANRVGIVAGAMGEQRLTWKDALTKTHTPEEISGLDTLVGAVPDTAKAAVKQLRADVLALKDRVSEVTIGEPFWCPRPTQDSVPSALRSRLLIGNGVIGFDGLMTFVEGESLRDLGGLTEPDQASAVQLFNVAANSGLSGGTLRLVTRRGSAAPVDQAITGTLFLTPTGP